MSWAQEALQLLELDADADERAIKRAYARLLRSNRPDDDPVAFQRLHSAYQTALGWYRHRQQEEAEQDVWEAPVAEAIPERDADDGTHLLPVALHVVPDSAQQQLHFEHAAAGVADPQQVTTQSTFTAPIDPESLAQRIISAAHSRNTEELAQWLRDCPELWSLADRELIAHHVAAQIFSDISPAMSASNFDLIAAMFGWDDISGPIDTDNLMLLRHNLHTRWLLQADNDMALMTELRHAVRSNINLADARKHRQLLTQPWHRMKALFAALDPSRVDGMRGMLHMLSTGDRPLPCPPLQAEQVQFWRDVSNEERLTRPRLQVGLLRGALFSLLWLLLPVGVYLIDATAARQAGKPWPAPMTLLPLACAGVLFCMAAGQGVLPWRLLFRRLLTPAALRILVPVLAVSGLALIHLSTVGFIGTFLASLALWLTIIRVFGGNSFVSRYAFFLMFGLYILSGFLLPDGTRSAYGQVAALLALALIGYEMLRYSFIRRGIR